MTKFKTLHIKPETWCRLNKIRSQLILAGKPHTFDDAVESLLSNQCQITDISDCPVVTGEDAKRFIKNMEEVDKRHFKKPKFDGVGHLMAMDKEIEEGDEDEIH